jgi:hypothetical protein
MTYRESARRSPDELRAADDAAEAARLAASARFKSFAVEWVVLDEEIRSALWSVATWLLLAVGIVAMFRTPLALFAFVVAGPRAATALSLWREQRRMKGRGERLLRQRNAAISAARDARHAAWDAYLRDEIVPLDDD